MKNTAGLLSEEVKPYGSQRRSKGAAPRIPVRIQAHTHPEQVEKQREYTRQWKRRNREKCREYQQRYWEKKAAQKNK